MLKKLLCFGLFFLLGIMLYIQPTSVSAYEIDATDDPTDEIGIPNENEENDSETSEKDSIVIDPNLSPIISSNSESQKQAHEEKVHYANVQTMADNLLKHNATVLDVQCYIAGEKEGKSRLSLITDCSYTDYTLLAELMKPTEDEKNWMKKSLKDLIENFDKIAESIQEWAGEIFGDL